MINGHDMLPGYVEPAAPIVETLLGQMTLDQKTTQMQGVPKTDSPSYTDIERSPDAMGVAGYDLRGYRYRDAGRGVNLDAGQDNRSHDDKNYATAFPAPSLRAASWDLDLECAWALPWGMKRQRPRTTCCSNDQTADVRGRTVRSVRPAVPQASRVPREVRLLRGELDPIHQRDVGAAHAHGGWLLIRSCGAGAALVRTLGGFLAHEHPRLAR